MIVFCFHLYSFAPQKLHTLPLPLPLTVRYRERQKSAPLLLKCHLQTLSMPSLLWEDPGEPL